MTKAEAMERVRQAFAEVPRPAEFGRGTCGCEECQEHERTLASHTPESIGMDELGNPGWDPICFANDAAFVYYLPAMLRLALETDYYADQLCFHLTLPGRLDPLSREQAATVLNALWALVDSARAGELDECEARGLEDAIARLDERLSTS
jgi:hypothetical protein